MSTQILFLHEHLRQHIFQLPQYVTTSKRNLKKYSYSKSAVHQGSIEIKPDFSRASRRSKQRMPMIPKGLWATFLGFFVSRVNHLKNQPLTQKNKRQHWKLKLIGQFWMTQYLKIFVKPQGLQISTLEQVSMSSNACFVLRRPPSPGWLDDVRQIRLNLIWTGGVKHRGAMPLPPKSRIGELQSALWWL